MTFKTYLTFDPNPVGYTATETSHGAVVTSMPEEYREQASLDYDFLAHWFSKMTKKQLVIFLAEAGKTAFVEEKKASLVTQAHLAQYGAWYPRMEVRR